MAEADQSNVGGGSREPAVARIVGSIRVLAAVALAVSAYLAWQSITGRGPAGCGPGSNCEDVLASRWSSWMGVPVSALAVSVYLAILIASGWIGARNPTGRRRLGWAMVTPLATMAAAAAGWFLVIQASVVGQFCPYCMVVHGCGVLIAGLTVAGLAALPGRGRDGHYRVVAGARPARVWALVLVGVVGVGVLAVGQVYGPQRPPRLAVAVGGGGASASRAVEEMMKDQRTGPATMTMTTTPTTRVVRQFPMGDDRVALDPREWPVLGSPDAAAVVAVMGDFTCPHCRVFHGMIERAVERYRGQLAVIVLLVPMNSDCNPRIKVTHPRHANACELTRIGLAVWWADPAAFGRLDHWMYETQTRARTPAEAREYATSLVGEAALQRGLADPVVEERIRQAVSYYDKLGGGTIPRLIPPKVMGTMQLATEQDLFRWLEAEMGVKAP